MDAPKLLHGERLLITKVHPSFRLPCHIFITPSSGVSGVLYLTNYRFLVVPDDHGFCYNNRLRVDFFEVPLLMIHTCERGTDKQFAVLEITVKDGRALAIGIQPAHMNQYNIYSLLYSHIFTQSIRNRFAYFHKLPTTENGWEVYNVHREYGRLGIHVSNSACIRTSRSTEDEEYLQAVGEAAQGLAIYDARPYLNAQANRAGGGGVENKSNYENVSVTFLNIENIHVMRNAWETLQSCNSTANSKYWYTVEKSGWLEHVGIVMAGARAIAERISREKSVLIHCSDGWDRTAQLCSLSQLYLDSYYRTLRGFTILIEKDWVSFGHQFEKRLGHANPNASDDQRSPIFVQFLDAVHQVLLQFPTHFEFNERLLLDLYYHAYSGRFGTFMGNCEKDRVACDLKTNTTSLWGYLLDDPERYLNPYYQPGMDEPIFPSASPRQMEVWQPVFSKWHSDFCYPLLGINSPEEHKEVLMRNAQEGLKLYKSQLIEKDAEIQDLKSQLSPKQL